MEKNKNWYSDFIRYIDIREPEVQISAVITAILFAVSCVIQMFNGFLMFEESIKNILTGFMGGFIGLLGIVLAGVAIIIGLFSKKEIELIQRVNGVNVMHAVLDSFKFSAISLGVEIIYLASLNLVISSQLPLVKECLFDVILVVTMYGIVFNLFYVISLMNECVELYKLKEDYDRALKMEKSLIDKANEQRIDYIFSCLIDNKTIRMDDIAQDLIKFINQSSIEDKDKVKEYIEQYYK